MGRLMRARVATDLLHGFSRYRILYFPFHGLTPLDPFASSRDLSHHFPVGKLCYALSKRYILSSPLPLAFIGARSVWLRLVSGIQFSQLSSWLMELESWHASKNDVQQPVNGRSVFNGQRVSSTFSSLPSLGTKEEKKIAERLHDEVGLVFHMEQGAQQKTPCFQFPSPARATSSAGRGCCSSQYC
jgi:hypothetical protein